ncbi:MAG: alpha/beta hydrolase [Actinomycetaceae bacterium]|nr:alpha/beta hydrolase [Actinomycetaceae bacterium]MDY5854159.1 alpha/beta hydrolase [Arcanobacterium sp.]
MNGASHIFWQPDVLGSGFESVHVQLHPDAEGPVVTTVIRHQPAADLQAHTPLSAAWRPQKEFAFLAIHGWNDYFYQRELARYISALGGHFYALDLRKYGRSHLEGQSWGYISDLSEYDAELHAALDIIFSEHGSNIPLFLYGHSTGGLTATLWAHRHPGVLAGLILNSPWLELQGSIATRLAGQGAIDALARLSPSTILPIPDSGFYHRTLTGNHLDTHNLPADAESDPFFTTGWEPNEHWRGTKNFAVRAGWFNAILAGHRQVAEGLDIDTPILVLTSAHSVSSDEWSDELLAADSVLTVENIWRRLPFLGRKITLVKLEGAIHDVLFSRADVRKAGLREIARFLRD